MKHSVEEVELKNGARGLLIDVPNASVMTVRVHFRGGMRYAKKPELYEIAHVVEHLSFGANAKYKDEKTYEAEFTKNGAYHNAWTSDFSVCYETECADFEWDRILDLKRVAITSPKFNEEELKSEKGNVKSELTGYLNDYSRLLWPRLQKAIGEDVADLRERINTLPNIELKDIREHYRRTHTAKNMRFIIAGQVKKRKKEILKNLESWELKEGKRFEAIRDELHSSPSVLIRRKDANNITFGFSLVTSRHLSADETLAMDALNHILNGTVSSRIFGEARRRGLVYSMGSDISHSVHYSSWDFDGEVNEESAEELFSLIQSEMVRVLNGEIDEKDIEAAKSYALGRFQMGAQTVGQIADYYTESYFSIGEINNYDNTPNIINKIDRATLVELAREFAASGIHAFVAVGSCEKALINNLEDKLKF
ncbi:MAG: pitrilysin family protein [Candidatus Saccharibacteria bacterium]|nr:insulinase family protein [Candidatus Saccharibacteria bacterium]MDO4967762.1 pitrilysin family protein [Candidatus Saccharibacteria bacterium]